MTMIAILPRMVTKFSIRLCKSRPKGGLINKNKPTIDPTTIKYTIANANCLDKLYLVILLIKGRKAAATAKDRKNKTIAILNCHNRIKTTSVVAATMIYQITLLIWLRLDSLTFSKDSQALLRRL